ncbi:MAG: hypothetical protein CMM46_06515 [Rhodospirillaceae bacterium]|nr:hypothetical protein [Rhodospirillaceae bacterium]|tara:strand:+ start:310 stop:1086 length:777 start_codon:yes stop_codon:yes gene_type:complete
MNHPPEVTRAFGYPFDPPGHGFLFVAGRALPFLTDGNDPLIDATVEIDGAVMSAAEALHRLGADGAAAPVRTPVVGYGSNASPQRLLEKYGDGAETVIPVLRCRLHDHDVVYATHIATYGSLPAGLARSSGTVAHVSVSLLTDSQLEIMHASEGDNYRFARLEALVEADGMGTVADAAAYITAHGVYGYAGEPVALARVAADNRRFTAREQEDMLMELCRQLDTGEDLHTFILRVVGDDARRRSLVMAMRERALDHGL